MDLPVKAERCECDSCSEGDCNLPLVGLANQVAVFNLNCIKRVFRAKGRICDFAIMWKTKNVIAVIELKGGRKNAPLERLREQIQGGLDILASLLDGQRVTNVYPILMYRAKKNPTAALAGRKVSFRGNYRTIIVAECGTPLQTILQGESR